jgi:hypothetical protein
MQSNPVAARTFENWHTLAEEGLPPPTAEIARNATITERYLAWYEKRPDLFKWAGMASFASRQVGIAIQMDAATAGTVRDLDIIRETNNLVYADIAWAHLAYDIGGLTAVVAALDDLPEDKRARYRRVREGFRLIDQGRTELVRDVRRGKRLVWKGNLMLLEHEQFETVQPQFERLSVGFSWALSLATSLEFRPDRHEVRWDRVSWFTWYMWTVGLPVLLWTRSAPDIVRLTHRWFWIRSRLLPLWQRIDATDRWLARAAARPVSVRPSPGAPGTPPTRARSDPPPPPPSR